MEDNQTQIAFDYVAFINQIPHNYPYECIGFILFLFYIFMYITGNTTNKKLALKFASTTYDFFKTNFTYVGVTNKENGPLLQSISSNSFGFIAQGRNNLNCLAVTIDLKKRQDLLSMLFFSFIWPERDTITIDIPIAATPQPICFALVKKRDAKSYKEANIDLKYLCEKLSIEKIDDNLTLVTLGEGKEPLTTIFDSKLCQALKKYDKYIQNIHFTDQKTLLPNPYNLRATLINIESLDDYTEFIQLMLQIVDKIANFKLSQSARQQYEEERAKFEEIKSRDEKQKKIEEAQKKKTEKLQKEKQKILSLPREQQIKLQEKEKRDEIKKKYAKRTMYM
ncbi:unnamed protein product [Paramecium pentaurelia]|uniref:Coiled-coil domain-containing protein 47 n=1 Tax=Paramecium pentaurelia TaxID=43138 RepID=A0A8S1XG60_9CILI|nr:unnamed protein product [Paramecium pentaurelia]